METEKAEDILHTCLCLRGLSAGILNKSHPRPTWSRALGQLSLPTALALLGKHCGPQCSQGSPKYHKAGRAGRGRKGNSCH